MDNFELLLPRNKLQKGDLAIENGFKFSVTTSVTEIERIGRLFIRVYSGIPLKYVIESVKKSTHVFTATFPISRGSDRIYEVPICMAFVNAKDKENNFTLELLYSISDMVIPGLNNQELAYNEFDLKYPKILYRIEEEYWGDVDEIKRQFRKYDVNYTEWKFEFEKISSIVPTKRVLKLGTGIIMIREIMKYFANLGKTSMNLYAARKEVIPYYKNMGFKLATADSTCEKHLFVDDMRSALAADGTIYMLLCDLQEGIDLVSYLSQKYINQLDVSYIWDLLNYEKNAERWIPISQDLKGENPFR